MPKVLRPISSAKRFIPVFGVLIISQALSGCLLNSKTQGSVNGDSALVTDNLGANNSLLQQSNKWAAKWQQNPADANVAIGYARSLRAEGSNQKAVQVLQQASLKSPGNQAVIAEYGKALSTVGQLEQALHNLNRAQSLGRPDWRIYSAQGITLDKMEQFARAREHYKSALNLKPNQPSVLNNIGLSYALEGNLASAETYLRRAAATQGSQPKIQRNLALVLGLSGKFGQSTKASNEVLSAEDTSENIAYVKNMLSPPGTWQKLSGEAKIAQSGQRKTKKQRAAKPRKITTLEKVKKATRKKEVSAKKALTGREEKSTQAANVTGSDTTAFNARIQQALATTQ